MLRDKKNDGTTVISSSIADVLASPTPAGSLYRSGTATATANNQMVVQMDSTVKVSGGMVLYSGGLYVPTPGWYSVSGGVSFAEGPANNRRTVYLSVSNVGFAIGTIRASSAIASAQDVGDVVTLSTSAAIYATTAQIFYLGVNVVGINWTLKTDQPYRTYLTAVRMGA